MSVIIQEPLTKEKTKPDRLVKLGKLSLTRYQAVFGAILLLAAILNLIMLNPNAFSNEYYAAAVRSMLTSWHNFFFNSFDPGGFVTVDKPPVFLWLETISAWIFGYNGITIVLPSALAGVGSVALLHQLVKKIFGPIAALVAAFTLAITPIAVIMNRHNNPESILIFFMLLGAWAIMRAMDNGKFAWLLLAMALMGIAFNVKMLEAFIVLPTYYLVYLLFAKVKWWKRFVFLAGATIVLVVVALSWTVIVDAVPASQRPFIGSSSNNTVMDLILGYNGLNRIDRPGFGNGNGGFPGGNNNGGFGGFGNNQNTNGSGQNNNNSGGFPGGNNNGGFGNSQNGTTNSNGTGGNNSSNGAGSNQGGTTNSNGTGGNNSSNNGGFQRGNNGSNGQPNGGFGQPPSGPNFGGFGGGNRGGFGGGSGGPGNGVIAGQAGPFRMFDQSLVGEASWLLPLALLGMLLAAVQYWFRFRKDKAQKWQHYKGLLLWSGWLLTFMVVFSMAGGTFHSYYLVLLAPGVAALAGISVEAFWYSYRQGGWQKWLLPIALVINAVFEFNVLSAYSNWNRTIGLAMFFIELISAAGLLALPRLLQLKNSKWTAGIATVGFLGLSIAPLAWAISGIFNQPYTNETLPTAVPVGANLANAAGFFGTGRNATGLFNTLFSHWNSELTLLLVALVAIAALAIVVRLFVKQMSNRTAFDRLVAGLAAVLVITLGGMLALNSMPTVNAATANATQPVSTGQIGNPQDMLPDATISKLVSYLETNRDNATYILATTTSNNAAPIIIQTGQLVMALGGFQGNDKILTATQFAQLVKDNTVRYVLLDSGGFGGFGGFGGGGSQSVTSWVQQTCKAVNSELWSATSTTTTTNNNNFGGFGRGSQATLYDCGS